MARLNSKKYMVTLGDNLECISWISNSKSMFQAPLRHIKPENYELMGYYQGLNSKFETLNKTKNELRFKTVQKLYSIIP